MSKYTILLPPSEGKRDGGHTRQTWQDIANDSAANAFRRLNPHRLALIEGLQTAIHENSEQAFVESDTPSALQKLFNVKGNELQATMEANLHLMDSSLSPAIERYTGVMFQYLDYNSLPTAIRHAFDGHTILFSGLWGILRPTDLIPNYRLKVDAKLPNIGSVTPYWKPRVSAVLNPLLTGHVVWDLLPGAHRKVWDGKAQIQARWQVKFVQKNGAGVYKTVTHWSKALKGALVRFICKHDVVDPAAFAQFEHPLGYGFHAEMSTMSVTGGELVFVKE